MHEGHRQRMREQMKKTGMDSLSDVQTLEVLLYFTHARGDTNEIAHRLLNRFGSLSAVLEAPPSELKSVEGVGEATAELISLFIQLERRHFLNRGDTRPILDTTAKCGQYLVPFFMGQQEEVVYLLCLDGKCKVIDCQLVHRGAVNLAEISVRVIVKTALEHNATSVVVAHNHPSGIALASEEDRMTTERIRQALEAVNIHFVDHIIVADRDYISMAADGLLD